MKYGEIANRPIAIAQLMTRRISMRKRLAEKRQAPAIIPEEASVIEGVVSCPSSSLNIQSIAEENRQDIGQNNERALNKAESKVFLFAHR